MPDTVASGVVRYLLTIPAVTAVVGSFPDSGTPWLFRDKLLARVEDSSSVAMVFSAFGQWSAPSDGSTKRFPRLSVEIYADPQRDATGNITSTSEAEVRGTAAWAVVNRFLHRMDSDTVNWGDLVTTGSTLLTEPQFYETPDGDHLLRGQALYGVQVSGNL